MRKCAFQGTLKFGASHIPAGESEVLVTHSAGAAPSSVVVTPSDGCEALIEVPAADIGATTFKVRLTGGISLDVDAYFCWVAVL